MKSITIHNIDGQLVELIKSKAKAKGTSVNKTILQLIEESLGIKSQGKGFKHRTDFSEFCGLWTKEDLAEFEKRTKEFEKIQPKDWK
ncbi:MAG: hypothetical protein EHM45_08515 [Desulfobacteraceae bacterium]|nr:MAG: hypothetical protein EHM45_08515 [Desulfobacteraceae bacterium]